MNPSEIKAVITKAFHGVNLGEGCSLRSAEEADNWGQPLFTDPIAYPDADITDDWTSISVETLDHFAHLAHMDGEGFRYYIPAFMLSTIDHYDSSMRVICTLGTLYPKRDGLWKYHMDLYSFLSREQCSTIAHYLSELHKLVELSQHDQKITERALRNYWHEFL